ncbi:site-specific DNA-methyltransferase [Mobiluncus porci]|uniref:Site-specific DNA-methyltransferase n=1 Tax=Mobiluncus porci TaxID=2652278 RepID=A0A7K0K2Q9_9ACTO|nr:site-specific DNA-methyltransferase [Mobiluncus porci]MST49776.1 site-specific DNA-methyltransferase [Mobiluncus porci]
MDKMRMESVDMTAQNIDRIAELFPNCITEALDEEHSTPEHKVYKKVVNFELLKQMLSGDVLEGDEAYEFTWVGKKAAIVEANKPIRKTLRPCPEESVDWDTTENMYIEGDNLEVLKLLQESYLCKIKAIYIDPPYNTGHDFIYPDTFIMDNEDYDSGTGYFDEDGNVNYQRENSASAGKYHSDWCSMLYSRLMLARNLLTDDGAIFVSIDENEQANIRKLLDEAFGEENKAAEFIVIRAEGGGMAKQVIKGHDYLFVYAKNISKFIPLGKPKDVRGKIVERDGETYWIQEDWLRKEFGKYGNCHYEEILEYKGQAKLDEINAGLANGEYILIPKPNGMNIVGKLRNLKEDSSKFYSILKHLSKNGIEDLKALDMDKYFSYPKPVSLIKEMISGITLFTGKKGDIVLDFFSGSATTAQAVMELNAEENGNRKFIMIQLPEPCDESTEAYQDGYKTIAKIGEERIRRAAKKISNEHPDAIFDGGFRIFKLDDSNMNDVYYAAGDYSQGMLSMLESNVKSDRSDLDLLFGSLLEWGLPLSMPYTSEKIEGCTVHTYNEGDLIACFDENIPDSVIKEIAKRQPLRAVFRDSSFNGSPAKINVGEIFKMLAPDTRVKVI